MGRDNGERHAASGIGLPGGAFDPVAASGLSGIRSPTRRKRTLIAPATRAPPHQTALGEEREHCATDGWAYREAPDHHQAEDGDVAAEEMPGLQEQDHARQVRPPSSRKEHEEGSLSVFMTPDEIVRAARRVSGARGRVRHRR